MINILLTIAYDGSDWQGYATQNHKQTVQDQLEMALEKLCGYYIKTYGASRTDSGVHAYNQKVVIKVEKKWQTKIKQALNGILPKSIYVVKTQVVSETFNPRHDVVSKEYHYVITTKYNPLKRNYCYNHWTKLDINLMKKAALNLVGEHDFSAFSSVRQKVNSRVREIYEIDIIQQKESEIVIKVIGKSFLYNMIRIIVGTLIEVGEEKIEPQTVKEILTSKERQNAGKTMPGHGLYLMEIQYEDTSL